MKCFSMLMLSGVLALPAGAMFVAAAPSQDNVIVVQEEEQTITGTIKSVDAERNRFVLKHGNPAENEVTIRVNDRTKYTLDGKDSTMEAALKEGLRASVKHRNNLASRVDASSQTE